MQNKIKLSLNKLQWSFLTQLIKQVVEEAPTVGHPLESCVIAELYKKHLTKLTFFPPGKQKTILALSWSEAFAINGYFSYYSEQYNIYIRMHLEPQLPILKLPSRKS